MRTTHRNTMRRLLLAAALSTGLGFITPISAQHHSYIVDLNSKTVTDLGTLGGGYATGINDAGQVVGYYYGYQYGYSDDVQQGFITGSNGTGMTALTNLGGYSPSTTPYAINAAGQVVGSSNATIFSENHAFITGPNGLGMTDLGRGLATGINDAGQVVVNFGQYGQAGQAFITGPNGVGMTAFITPGAGFNYANGINASGQVVGYYYGGGGRQGFITGPNGVGMTELGTLGGSRIFTWPYAINAAGQVVGVSNAGFLNDEHAFSTGPNGVGMTDLGTLPGEDISGARGVNDIGQIVGWSYNSRVTGGSTSPFIAGPNGIGMIDLNSLVSVPGVTFTDAIAINNHGQVLTIGNVPEPETYALLLAGLGLIGFMARWRKAASAGLL